MHSAGAGGVIGAIIAYAAIFNFNPVWWLCLAIFVSGIVGSARIILRQHSLAQVLAGFFVGLICSVLGLIYL